MPVDLLHDEGRSRASWSCAIFLLAPQADRARVTMMYAHVGMLTQTPFCFSLRLLRYLPSLHIHLKRTSMCGFSLNPPPPPPGLSPFPFPRSLFFPPRAGAHGRVDRVRTRPTFSLFFFFFFVFRGERLCQGFKVKRNRALQVRRK